MLEAFLYLFAAYGLWCFFYFNLLRRPITHCLSNLSYESVDNGAVLVCQVKDAEQNIEYLVHKFVQLEHCTASKYRLAVIDTGSQDQTKEILQRLSYRYPYLTIEFQQEKGTKPTMV